MNRQQCLVFGGACVIAAIIHPIVACFVTPNWHFSYETAVASSLWGWIGVTHLFRYRKESNVN